jgi:hypothetical protein
MSRFFERLLGKHTCDCGAVYEVTVLGSPSPDTDDACCEVCGKLMDSWQHSTTYPSYHLITQKRAN